MLVVSGAPMYEAGASIMVPRGLVIKPGGFVMQHFRFLIKWDGLINPPVHHVACGLHNEASGFYN